MCFGEIRWLTLRKYWTGSPLLDSALQHAVRVQKDAPWALISTILVPGGSSIEDVVSWLIYRHPPHVDDVPETEDKEDLLLMTWGSMIWMASAGTSTSPS